MNLTKAKETKTRVCCLYRVSTKGQVDKAENDIPMQKKACHEFAESKGWTIIKEHAELGVSGFKVAAADRDELQEIKREAEKQEFDILLVFMFDRLGRKDNETPFVLKWFVEQGISVWSTVEGEQRFDSNVDDLLNYIRFWQASSESQKTSVRIKTRMKQIVEDGHYMGGTVPFGYRAVYKGRMNKKGRPVKDLEIDPREGEIVREIFFKVAREGYSAHGIARMLNERNIVTHGGARFQTNHVLRMLRHRGYTGYMIAKENTSGFIPELQIVEESIYEDAMAIVEQRKKENEQRRGVAQSSYNKTLLAGNLYCAHCGTRLSGFWHKDRYRLADGTVKEVMAPKYNCYAKGLKVRPCDGQQLYKAEIVDEIVEGIAKDIFAMISRMPKDPTIEAQLKKNIQNKENLLRELDAKLQSAKKELELYEAQIIKCIEGKSKLSEATLARMISRAEDSVAVYEKEIEKARMDKQNQKDTAAQIEDFYKEFKGWADEYESAALERRRVILSQLFSRIEIGRGYEVKVEIAMSYKQFLNLTGTRKRMDHMRFCVFCVQSDLKLRRYDILVAKKIWLAYNYLIKHYFLTLVCSRKFGMSDVVF